MFFNSAVRSCYNMKQEQRQKRGSQLGIHHRMKAGAGRIKAAERFFHHKKIKRNEERCLKKNERSEISWLRKMEQTCHHVRVRLTITTYLHRVYCLYPTNYLHIVYCLYPTNYLDVVYCLYPTNYLHNYIVYCLYPTNCLHIVYCLYPITYLHIVYCLYRTN